MHAIHSVIFAHTLSFADFFLFLSPWTVFLNSWSEKRKSNAFSMLLKCVFGMPTVMLHAKDAFVLNSSTTTKTKKRKTEGKNSNKLQFYLNMQFKQKPKRMFCVCVCVAVVIAVATIDTLIFKS